MVIRVSNLSKYYKVYHKQAGIMGSLKALVLRKYESVKAVENISFEINEGELVGFIGPNGAGKTTTLKCLSGLLYPTSGNVSILGFTPYERKNKFLKQIALVMGQKNQLWWDLPAMESFLLNKEIYEIDDKKFKETVSDLSELLDIKNILNIQVRKLSLGQRMKCELVAALIHSPKVLFLDEPTIGLDVVMQKKLRDFVKEYNKKFKSTILLTSHYMEDVKELCERVIIIDRGKILFDGKLEDIIKKYDKNKLITIVFEDKLELSKIEKLGRIVEYDPPKVILSVPRGKSNHVAAQLLEEFQIDDLNIEESKIEDIIRDVFSKN